jgi:spore photoproduct lyase
VVKRFDPEEVWIERSEAETPLARTVRARVPESRVRIVDDPREAEAADFAAAKRRLVLMRKRGRFLEACPGGTDGVVCCNYLVLNVLSNCPLDCSYCFLQEYLANNPAVKAFTNVDDALAELEAVLRAHPGRRFRIGTGELADSLALDPLTGLSRILVPFVRRFPNALLELKTKTDCIDELLDIEPDERVVVSWSVNPPAIAEADERGAAMMQERIEAAHRVQCAGFRVGLHFDPLVEYDGWEQGYGETIEAIFSRVDPQGVAWVSLGTLRLTPGLESVIRRRGIARRILGSEMVPSADGKSRIWYGLRSRMYRFMIERLRAIEPRLPIYLCMESPLLWRKVMREVPSDRALGLRLAAGAEW